MIKELSRIYSKGCVTRGMGCDRSKNNHGSVEKSDPWTGPL